MAYCGKCGSKVIDGNRFCTNCGAEIQVMKQPAPSMDNYNSAPVNTYPNSGSNQYYNQGGMNYHQAPEQNYWQKATTKIKERVDSFPKKLLGLAIVMSIIALYYYLFDFIVKFDVLDNTSNEVFYLFTSLSYFAFIFLCFLFIKIGINNCKSKFSGLLKANLAVSIIFCILTITNIFVNREVRITENYVVLNIISNVYFIISLFIYLFYLISSLVLSIKFSGKIKTLLVFLFAYFAFNICNKISIFTIFTLIPIIDDNFYYDNIELLIDYNNVRWWIDSLISIILIVFICINAFRLLRNNK